MANNFVSYERFFARPPNIAEFGTTVEELKLQSGKPEADPVHSPMAAPRVPEARLALAPAGSDRLRLGTPAQPDVNPYEGAHSTLSLNRSALLKLSGRAVEDLEVQVKNMSGLGDDVRSLMLDSFSRLRVMVASISHLKEMAELVQVRSIAASKG